MTDMNYLKKTCLLQDLDNVKLNRFSSVPGSGLFLPGR